MLLYVPGTEETDLKKVIMSLQQVAAAAISALPNVRLAQTADYTVLNADKGNTIALSGGWFTLTFGAASGYDANFSVMVLNEDSMRAKWIAPNGITAFYLWPGQSVIVFNSNNVWQTLGKGRWRLAGGTLNLYTDFAAGNDLNDGLATGAGNAKKTLQGALDQVSNEFDFGSNSGISALGNPSLVVINMLAGSTDATGAHLATHAFTGATGRAAVVIDGGAGATISTTSADAFAAFCNVQVELQNITLKTTTSGDCLSVNSQAQVVLNAGMNFGACAGSHMSITHGGKILLNANYTVSGTFGTAHMLAQHAASEIYGNGLTVTLTANVGSVSTWWALNSLSSAIINTGYTFTLGAFAVTGKRYQSDVLSLISTNTGSATYFPGTIAGTTSSGAVYQ